MQMSLYDTWKILKMPQRTIRINKCSKITGYKINIQKSVAFLYTNNKLPEKQIKKTVPSTTA